MLTHAALQYTWTAQALFLLCAVSVERYISIRRASPLSALFSDTADRDIDFSDLLYLNLNTSSFFLKVYCSMYRALSINTSHASLQQLVKSVRKWSTENGNVIRKQPIIPSSSGHDLVFICRNLRWTMGAGFNDKWQVWWRLQGTKYWTVYDAHLLMIPPQCF